MSTPDAPVLTVTTDKTGYAAGETITVTAVVTLPVKDVVTVSGTLPDGTVVSGQATVTVNVPVGGDVQFGASDSFGEQRFAIASSAGNQAVLTAPAPASVPA
jgi:hypothetical protein